MKSNKRKICTKCGVRHYGDDCFGNLLAEFFNDMTFIDESKDEMEEIERIYDKYEKLIKKYLLTQARHQLHTKIKEVIPERIIEAFPKLWMMYNDYEDEMSTIGQSSSFESFFRHEKVKRFLNEVSAIDKIMEEE